MHSSIPFWHVFLAGGLSEILILRRRFVLMQPKISLFSTICLQVFCLCVPPLLVCCLQGMNNRMQENQVLMHFEGFCFWVLQVECDVVVAGFVGCLTHKKHRKCIKLHSHFFRIQNFNKSEICACDCVWLICELLGESR